MRDILTIVFMGFIFITFFLLLLFSMTVFVKRITGDIKTKDYILMFSMATLLLILASLLSSFQTA